ncbi:MAG: FtsX-like permease family protein [Streptosporangiales bacterium]|nr:FtsX-like permease family protein [Streptosporangiales bacterium]
MRLGADDLVRTGAGGLRARPARVVLSALGIAIGIATMVAVVGISESSRADLMRSLDRLGTNLLTVSAGQSMFGGEAELPEDAVAMVDRIGPVTDVGAIGSVTGTVRRTDRIPKTESGGIAIRAATLELPATLRATMASGVWLNAATARYPVVVLGSTAARRLGVSTPGRQVWLGEQWFTVAGVLAPVALAPELDTAALIGFPVAESRLDFDGHPTTVYERSDTEAVEDVRSVLAATVNPENPDQVEVSRPSDALAAKAAAAGAFTDLLLGLGAVALLVGGVGVANTMVISVLERRSEIGLRRALGATSGQIRAQFLTESVLLSAAGGAAGAVLGAAATAIYAIGNAWTPVLPIWTFGAALAGTLLVGAVAGLYPAVRAARLSPAVALTTT